MDIRSIQAAQKYAAARPATEPTAGTSEMGEAFAGLAHDFASTLAESEDVAMQSMTDEADPHTLVQALAQAELAVETAVTVRDKVVEAYQEILRMPI
ncbi:flagellar hook-basal body complex protein FliE [Salinihabitans flavidus]|uniref:Flagellar hook-basal body complex protein FliE n=1 Tax=Salinihabitans flavidus TaxID=569882 RepID=A0A1H8LQ95_9RHOB|nr:flagellar hook-basal body complex protein FliE [Salinihabitans flavidus]SEO07250.1 flagellar hook-basal body complex protein FliE [Salinihabitans flavidus]